MNGIRVLAMQPALTSIWRSSLWRKQALLMAASSFIGILGFGLVEMAATFSAAREQASRLQASQAREVAQAITASLVNVQRHVRAISTLPWEAENWLELKTRREEFARLLRLVPAVESIAYRDAQGRPVLVVSRREVDRMSSLPAGTEPVPARQVAASPTSPASSAFGQLEYRDDHDPVLDVELKYPEPTMGGSTAVRVGLRALARDLGGALSLEGSEVYAADAAGTVVLHRDPTVVLARKSVALNNASGAAQEEGIGLRGDQVLRAVVALPGAGWLLVVEQPRSVVMSVVWSTVRRTALFLALGVAVSVALALYLASRVTRPVRLLNAAVARIGAGNLNTLIHLRTHDELEDLATQFNRMAASLQASYTDLEDKVTARTLALQRATHHKSEFLANMSHELRTPLNAILGFADVLREGMAGPLGAEQREYIADIHASGLHLLALINDVLDLSKIEAGQLDLERSDFSVPDTVASAVALVRQRALQKSLALQVDVAPTLGLWHADERRFKQVLLNLLSNAVKFTPDGGRVTVQAGLSDDPREGLWVSVQDTGIGIAAADHEAVFQEFRQVGGDSAGRAEGTGLGLALARRLVEQHGGCITLHSEPGAGSCFRFNIPGSPA